MTDSPYKPPTVPKGAGGGHAPIPSVPVAARRHGAIPAAPVQLPRRPLDAGEEEDQHEKTEPANRWAYQYRGNAGTPPGDIDGATNEFPLKPSIELPEARPLAVLFYQDTQTLQPATTPTSQNFAYYVFDGAATDDTDIQPGRFRLGSSEQLDATTIYIAVPPSDGNLKQYLERNVTPQIEVQYESSWLRFTVTAWEFHAGDDADYLTLTVTLAASHIHETTTPGAPSAPTTQTFTDYTFDDTATVPAGLADNRFRLNDSGDQTDSTELYIAVPVAGGSLREYLEQNSDLSIELNYGTSWIIFTIDGWTMEEGIGVDLITLQLTIDSELINESEGPIDDAEAVELVLHGMSISVPVVESDGPIDDAQAVTVVASGFALPNAAVRARVRYRTGKSDVQFDCDWSGGFMVHADRLEIARVVFAPDTTRPYIDANVDISATVLADAPRPGGSISLTVPPVAVPRPTGERYYAFPIHALARRVNLMLKYGNDEDAPGDAPLGQIFLAFVGKYDRSLCYIDAMAAREALFGAGLPVPSGVSKLVVSNRSLDDSIQIGVVWRLDI